MIFLQQVRNRSKSRFQFTFCLAWGTSCSTTAMSALLVNNCFVLFFKCTNITYCSSYFARGIAHSQCLLIQLILNTAVCQLQFQAEVLRLPQHETQPCLHQVWVLLSRIVMSDSVSKDHLNTWAVSWYGQWSQEKTVTT